MIAASGLLSVRGVREGLAAAPNRTVLGVEGGVRFGMGSRSRDVPGRCGRGGAV